MTQEADEKENAGNVNATAARATGAIASSPIPVRLDGIRILTVDDEADARAVMIRAGKAGATVAVADSVSRA